jgi:hypothetical protein
VSGVRSSWLTVEMNSSFSRSSSRSRLLASRNSAEASFQLRDFCSSRRLYSRTWVLSSRMVMTSSMLSTSPITIEEIITRAEAAPIAPASSRSV